MLVLVPISWCWLISVALGVVIVVLWLVVIEVRAVVSVDCVVLNITVAVVDAIAVSV